MNRHRWSMLDFFSNRRIIPPLQVLSVNSNRQREEERSIFMSTEELKKQAVESLLEQRTYVQTEIEENFFERTQNMDARTYRSEFEKHVVGHINSGPEITFKPLIRARAAVARS